MVYSKDCKLNTQRGENVIVEVVETITSKQVEGKYDKVTSSGEPTLETNETGSEFLESFAEGEHLPDKVIIQNIKAKIIMPNCIWI